MMQNINLSGFNNTCSYRISYWVKVSDYMNGEIVESK